MPEPPNYHLDIIKGILAACVLAIITAMCFRVGKPAIWGWLLITVTIFPGGFLIGVFDYVLCLMKPERKSETHNLVLSFLVLNILACIGSFITYRYYPAKVFFWLSVVALANILFFTWLFIFTKPKLRVYKDPEGIR
jgi:hypothetical protein